MSVLRGKVARRVVILGTTLVVLATFIVLAARGGGPAGGGRTGGGGKAALGLVSAERTALLRDAAVRVRASGDGDVAAAAVSDVGAPPVPLGSAAVRDGVATVRLSGAGVRAVGACSTSGLRLGGKAGTTVALEDDGPPCGRFFSDRAAYNDALGDDAPLDPRSDALVAALDREVRSTVARGFGPGINVRDYSTGVVTVGADQPKVRVALPPEKAAFQAPFDGVPLPADAEPAEGTDRHLVLYQPSSDTVWEFFGLARAGDGWTTKWGARIDRESAADGVVAAPGGVKYGATASSLALAGGLITPADLRRGRIDHALAIALPKTRRGVWAAPALRTDGVDPSPDALPEGARLRLDPSADVDGMGLAPFTRMLAEAAQRYGLIVRDQSGAISLYAQTPGSEAETGLYHARIGGLSSQEVLRQFPWDRLQVLRMRLSS